MRSEMEVEEFSAQVSALTAAVCKACKGSDEGCRTCDARALMLSNAFEACVPRDFWDTTEKEVRYNVDVFRESVLPYCAKLGTAQRGGYGLLFLGDNGVGKTFFMSWVLMHAIRRGCTSYYTSMPQLDYDLKRGFNDRLAEERLRHMLTSDFLAVDELGKEKFKAGDNYTRLQVERILKQRFDDSKPVLLATNMTFDEVEKEYGKTLGSILTGKYRAVTMEPGDFRDVLKSDMDKKMGWKK